MTSGLSAIKMIATAGKAGKMVMEGGLNAVGAGGESMIHGLDGNQADLGKALTATVSSVPGIGNASTMSKITSGSVQNKVSDGLSGVVSQEVNDGVSKLAGDTAGALVGSGVKGAENWAKDQDKLQ